MTEYWIWNNSVGAWWDKKGSGFTRKLHDAGRFAEHIARERLQGTNMTVPDTDYPDEVMIPVNNTFLTAETQRILAEYEKTGDRKVIDDAYFGAVDRVIIRSEEFQESWSQMLRGEGREIEPQEFFDKTNET